MNLTEIRKRRQEKTVLYMAYKTWHYIDLFNQLRLRNTVKFLYSFVLQY